MKNFTEVKKHVGQGARTALKERVALNVRQNIAHILLSRDIYERLGSPNYVTVAVGNGPQKGKVLVTPAKTGYVVVNTIPSKHKSAKKGQVRVSIAASKIGASTENTKTATVPFQLVDEGLIVRVA